MSLFSRKTPEEKAAAKQERKDLRAAADARRDRVLDHLTKLERTTYYGPAHNAAQLLADDETILLAATGEEDGSDKKACIVCTDRRIIIGTAGLSAGQIDLPYDGIDKVDVGSTLRGGWVTLHNGSQKTRVEKSVSSNIQEIRQIVRDHQVSAPEDPASSVGPGVEDLAKLADLHAAGVLTDDEFTAAKAKALGL